MKWKDWDFNLKVRLFGESVHNLLFWMFFPFMAIYFADSFGKEMAGLLLVLAQVVSVAVGLVGGYCADYFGRKRMMVLAALGDILCFGLFALANSPWYHSPTMTFISFSLLGLFGAIYWPASHAMVADVVPEKHRSSVFAVFYTSINIAVVFGPILGGIFFFTYRFEFLLVCMAVSVTLAVVLKRYIRETVPAKREIKRDKTKGWVFYLGQQLDDYKVITKDMIFLLFVVAGILVAQTFMQLDLLIAVYLTEAVGEQTVFNVGNWSLAADGKQIFSWLLAENGFIVALFTVAMTKWMTKYKERNVFVASSLFYGVAIILFGHTVNIWMLVGAMALFTTAELMVVGFQESFVSKLAPEHMRGQYFAASSLRFTIGRTIAPFAIPLTVWVGFQWTFIILGVTAFLSAILYYIMFNLFEKRSTAVRDKVVVANTPSL